MPNKTMHRARGANAAVEDYLASCGEKGHPPDIVTMVAVAWLGGVAGNLPDYLDDPARGPSHRGWAHSLEAYGFLHGLYIKARKEGRTVEAAVLRAAMTHHEEDAQTPAGLPSLLEILFRRFFN